MQRGGDVSVPESILYLSYPIFPQSRARSREYPRTQFSKIVNPPVWQVHVPC